MVFNVCSRVFLFTLLSLVLSVFYVNDAIAFTAQERMCASMFYSCDGAKSTTSNCTRMKKLTTDLGFSCRGLKRKTKKVFSCFNNTEQQIDPKAPDWLAVSWDKTNPKIFAACENEGAENARRCAVAKCKANGGKQCKPACSPNTGVKLRACRLGVNTYVASSTYGRLGCGARYVRRGVWTPSEYAARELRRCKEKSKSPDCAILKRW